MTGNTVVDIVIAVVIGLIIWRVSMKVIYMLSTPPPELDPEDVVEVDQDYKCSVCGADACRSQRLIPDAGTVLIGGSGKYEARCRACFRDRDVAAAPQPAEEIA